uniref:Lipase-like C-terminal domain-containing protein n=1 Tax=Globisporangium ultimum (strain ATCC 200006 / CBS 805.95 / DAOM BR144) TaxID=431595 RepID=K3WXL6_GLOUD
MVRGRHGEAHNSGNSSNAALETETKFPVVFIHGVFGYGRQRPLWNYWAPYWPEAQLQELNRNHVIADVGVASSDHDRACELFYQLRGGTVDYGEQHASEADHARFGVTFETSLHPEWSADNPVHLVGHSFGATTGIELYQLLCADFFGVGSNHKWIRSIVSVAGPLTGSTLSHMMGLETRDADVRRGTGAHLLAVGFSFWFKLYQKFPILKNGYDMRMPQWGKHSLGDLMSTQGPVQTSKDNALFDALPAYRIRRNAELVHMEKLYLMSITTTPRTFKHVPVWEVGAFCAALFLVYKKKCPSWLWPALAKKWTGVRALLVALIGMSLWRRAKTIDIAKIPSMAALVWLMRRRVKTMPVIFDGFDIDHWGHNDGAVNIHSMLRPWFPKPQDIDSAFSEDAQAASIPASASSSSLAAAADSSEMVRCASHISIDGFHHKEHSEKDDEEQRLHLLHQHRFEKGRWYVYRIDANHLAGTFWHHDAKDLYKSLFTLMAHEYEREYDSENDPLLQLRRPHPQNGHNSLPRSASYG